MKLHPILLGTLLAVVSLPTLAGLRAPIDAYEAALQGLQLPQSATGTVTIGAREGCATCRSLTFRVTATTRYRANGQSYSLSDYRRLLATVRDRETTYLTIVHDRDSASVIEIRVNL